MKKTLLAAAVTAAAFSTSAIADTKLSGQINYVAGALEDFNGNDGLTVTDAGIWSSRFRITSQVKDSHGIKYGLRIEYGIGSGAGNGDNGSGLGQRVNEFYVKGSAGKLSIGLGSEASDGALEKDFSGTYTVNNSELESFGLSNLQDDQATTDGGLSSSDAFAAAVNGILPGSAPAAGLGLFPQLDGGRTQRIRYDTPKLGGLASFSVSYDTDETVIGRVDAGGKGWGFAAFVESSDDDEQGPTGVDSSYGASLGFKAFGGFTASIAYAELENEDDDEVENIRLILGYRSGKHSIAVDYVQTTFDFDNAAFDAEGDIENESVGLGYVYRATKGVELYASIRQAESDLDNVFDNGTDDEGTGFLIGSRIVF